MGTGLTEILVLDDDPSFVDAVVERLRDDGSVVSGYSSVEAFGRAARSGMLNDVRLMFFDMNLGPRPRGGTFTAADVIPVARTYVPSANILIFSHKGISLENCIHCVQLGALGLIPKSDNLDELLLAAKVYPHIGDARRATEATIKELWVQLQGAGAREKGQLFEMLVANILSTVPGLSFIGNNWNKPTGEIDLIFQNDIDDRSFWTKLNSFHIIVECKNRIEPSETSDFATFKAKVKAKGHCRVGIMASWNKVSSGFRNLQQHTNNEEEVIFLMDRNDLAALASRPSPDRESYLRGLFSPQL